MTIRLIDANALVEELKQECKKAENCLSRASGLDQKRCLERHIKNVQYAINAIESAPTVECECGSIPKQDENVTERKCHAEFRQFNCLPHCEKVYDGCIYGGLHKPDTDGFTASAKLAKAEPPLTEARVRQIVDEHISQWSQKARMV